MEIKVVQDAKSIEADILVVNKFEDENTTNELANKYAVEQDNFKGKFGETYLLPTYGKEIYRKELIKWYMDTYGVNKDQAVRDIESVMLRISHK